MSCLMLGISPAYYVTYISILMNLTVLVSWQHKRFRGSEVIYLHLMRGAVCVCFLLLFTTSILCESLTFVLEAKNRECFLLEVPRKRRADFSWQILRGGKLDALVTVENRHDLPTERGEVLYQIEHQGDYVERYVMESAPVTGTYALCFDNSKSKFTKKVISFSVLHYDYKLDPVDDDDELFGPRSTYRALLDSWLTPCSSFHFRYI